MNVKEAINTAKNYVKDIFGEEGISNVGLEEVAFDDGKNEWRITIGFLRDWDANRGVFRDHPMSRAFNRTYKVIQIDQEGRVSGVTAREIET